MGVTVFALAGAAACSSSSYNSSSPPASSASSTASAPASSAAAADTITIQSFAFSAPLTVAPGAQITVMNKDSVEHTVTADSSGGFDVSVPSGGSATFTAPNAAGTYAFHCSIHPNMHGTLIVK